MWISGVRLPQSSSLPETLLYHFDHSVLLYSISIETSTFCAKYQIILFNTTDIMHLNGPTPIPSLVI